MIKNQQAFSYPPIWQQALPLVGASACLGCTLGTLIHTVRRVWFGACMLPALQMAQGTVGMALMTLGTHRYVRKQVSVAASAPLDKLITTTHGQEEKQKLLDNIISIHQSSESSLAQLNTWPFIRDDLTPLAKACYKKKLLSCIDECAKLWAPDLGALVANNQELIDETRLSELPRLQIYCYVQRAAFKYREDPQGLTYKISKNGNEHYLLGITHPASRKMLTNPGFRFALRCAEKIFIERLDADYRIIKSSLKRELFETSTEYEIIAHAKKTNKPVLALEEFKDQSLFRRIASQKRIRNIYSPALEENSVIAAWILGSKDNHDSLARCYRLPYGLVIRNEKWLNSHLLKPNALYGKETVTVAVGFLHISHLLTALKQDGFTVEKLTSLPY